jgi:hypothetical protein
MPIVSQRQAEQANPRRSLSKPKLVELLPDNDEPQAARAVSTNRLGFATDQSLVNSPALTIGALSCAQQRLANDVSVDVELVHAGCGLRSVMYSAHNVGVGCFPAQNRTTLNPDALGEITLLIHQHIGQNTQTSAIKVNASRVGSYMLAIPTDAHARVPMWRSTRIQLDDDAQPTQIRSLFDARTRSCMLMSVQINESHAQTEGESHAK